MSITFNPAAIPGRHTLSFRTRDAHRGYPVREVEVLATPAEIQGFARDGYIVRENLIPPAEIERLRAALDEVLANEREEHIERGSATFTGTFLRHLADKHEAFFEMIDFAPVVSIARALFGPAVSLRGFTARICYPDDPKQEVEWHIHQRVVPDPLPPMFQVPQVLDCLLYLDDIDERNGPLCVIPGSHLWHERDLDTGVVESLPGEVMLKVPAGSAVLAHGALWHRAMPTLPGGTLRRLLIFGYSPAWQKAAIYGVKPEDGLTNRALGRSDLSSEMKELLGIEGYM